MKSASNACEVSWWLTGEAARYERFRGEMDRLFEERGVMPTPLMEGRVEEIAILDVLVCRLLAKLKTLALQGESADTLSRDFIVCVETLLKTLEKWRKAMNELEDVCAKAGTPIDVGVADKMKPLLRETQGVMDKALKQVAARPRKARPRRAALPSQSGNLIS
ncbi:MAG: hypothetical protein KA184_11955 [Candidatus Hydrogenedentes bacterium]|nr:hypothetical protein [Candidatus Hydrogenedentota bacterium]